MDWGYKVMLTACLVAAVMMATRLFDRRWAGMLAGAPVITAPALLWLAHDQGPTFAAHSAIGSIMVCCAAAVFAAAYVALARRAGPAVCTAGASACALLVALLLQGLQGQAGLLLLMVALTATLVLAWLGPIVDGSPVRPLSGEPWISAGVAGAVTGVVSALAPAVGAFWSGALTGLPLVAACGLIHVQRGGGAANLRRFAQGYVIGVIARAAFGFVFAALVPSAGTSMALAASAAVGGVAMVVLSVLHRLLSQPLGLETAKAPQPAVPAG